MWPWYETWAREPSRGQSVPLDFCGWRLEALRWMDHPQGTDSLLIYDDRSHTMSFPIALTLRGNWMVLT